MEKACGGCTHYYQFGETNTGICRAPIPYWMLDEEYKPFWIVREDHIHKCNCYNQAETQEARETD